MSKKRRGPKPRADSRKRVISVKVNDAEHAVIVSNASKRGKHMSDFLRNLGLSPPCEPEPDGKQ